jgi:hypothetical protein
MAKMIQFSVNEVITLKYCASQRLEKYILSKITACSFGTKKNYRHEQNFATMMKFKFFK